MPFLRLFLLLPPPPPPSHRRDALTIILWSIIVHKHATDTLLHIVTACCVSRARARTRHGRVRKRTAPTGSTRASQRARRPRRAAGAASVTARPPRPARWCRRTRRHHHRYLSRVLVVGQRVRQVRAVGAPPRLRGAADGRVRYRARARGAVRHTGAHLYVAQQQRHLAGHISWDISLLSSTSASATMA